MLINSYRFGEMVVDAVAYHQDLILLPDKIIMNWWRQQGHIFALDDCREIIAVRPDWVIFGMGAYSRVRLSEDLTQELERLKINYETLATESAVEAFNEKVNLTSFKVAGAFHLTC